MNQLVLRSITANKVSGGDGIPAELFQILKDDAVKVLHSICQKIWKTQQWPQRTGKGQFSFQSQRKAIPKNVQATTQLPSAHTNKVMLKILQARRQQNMHRELPDVQAGFIKGRGTRDQIANICWTIGKARGFQNNIYICFIEYTKAFVWITTNWKILHEMGTPDHLIFLLRNPYAAQESTVRTRHGTMDWFQIGKGVCQGCILSPCLFNLYAENIM